MCSAFVEQGGEARSEKLGVGGGGGGVRDWDGCRRRTRNIMRYMWMWRV